MHFDLVSFINFNFFAFFQELILQKEKLPIKNVSI